MAVLNVLSNGNAPANARIGDTIQTAGGNYTVVSSDYPNATYNPSSGFYSVRSDDYSKDLSQSIAISANNSAKSQAYAREQMEWQEEQNAKAMQFNSEEAQKNRDWQESMSNSAHQREVQDLINAGLNPALSALSGNGASVTSGATASGVTSSGASGTVDNSANSTIASMYAAALNASTNLAITDMNNKASLDVAAINAKAQEAVANTYTQMSYRLKENFPEFGQLSYSILSKLGLSDALTSDSAKSLASGAYGLYGDYVDELKSFGSYLDNAYSEIFGNGSSNKSYNDFWKNNPDLNNKMDDLKAGWYVSEDEKKAKYREFSNRISSYLMNHPATLKVFDFLKLN